jgi:serine/threonine-protein kinase
MIAGRYRIVGLLGRGGMGEVYRADDLKLGQPVALKFLPVQLERDESRLARFLNEVRIARQVAHPNVCRVYDIGEVEGQHFLSMEFVDGEDLASLLRRIGRLPGDKAVEIARDVCAGLAAAHARRVIHRDLKPNNVMIDGRGRVRITDFGLAGLADGFVGAEIRVGTPAYMSPEQLAGKEVTVRSDLYALGLVLYELFTGKAAFDAPTIAELSRQQQETTPTTPSTLVRDLDPAVERVILRCLDREPGNRPTSALAVAAALPGGDPLSAALAAGETPSPEMVAAAGPQGGLRPGVATAYLALVLVGLIGVALLFNQTTLYNRVPFERPLAALGADARGMVGRLGYTEAPRDTACSINASFSALQYLARKDSTDSRWDTLSRPDQMVVYFFYRQSDEHLVPSNLGGVVTSEDPYPEEGDVELGLGLDGRLLHFVATPPLIDTSGTPSSPPDWTVPFELAGLDIETFEPVAPTIQPRVFADARQAWSGLLPGQDDLPVRVEAAALHGRPVFFRVVTPYDPYWPEDEGDTGATTTTAQWAQTAFFVLFVIVAAGAIFLAVRNLRLGRGDLRGALRLALYILALSLLYWIATGHHVANLTGETVLFIVALGNALALGLLAWVLYMALEPYARRLWPEALVSWTRLLAGRLRDPLVGRDLLIGFAFAVGLHIMLSVGVLAPSWLGLPPTTPNVWAMEALNGGRWAFGQLFIAQLVGLSVPLGHFLLFLLLRIVLRRQWLAAIAYCAIIGGLSALNYAVPGSGEITPALVILGIINGLVIAVLVLTMLVRFGILTAAGCFMMANLLSFYPITLDTGASYFPTAVFGLIVAVGIAGVAYLIALAGRPLFGDSILQD